MKELSCHNAKIVAYCREVRQLEDKFNGLELSHIPRRLNKAADVLAKMAFGQEPVLMGVFASDQHKPSVRYEEQGHTENELLALGSGADRPPAPSNPKVIELDKDLVVEPDPLAH